jgi:hypothetical protein
VKTAVRYLKAARIITAHPSLLKRASYIFFLSHVRGYTTLLSHILGSHAEISGYAEAWLSYQSSLDLLKLRFAVCYHGNYKPNCRYFLDKILHNRLRIAESILKRGDIRYVFMIREPLATLKSVVALYRKYIAEGGSAVGCTLPSSLEDAVDHYINRMRRLADIGEHLRRFKKQALVVKAETLVNDPHYTLSEITQTLELSRPLTQHYSIFARTGAWNYGDTSDFILKQRIEPQRSQHAEIVVPDELLARASVEREKCLIRLQHCFSMVERSTTKEVLLTGGDSSLGDRLAHAAGDSRT